MLWSAKGRASRPEFFFLEGRPELFRNVRRPVNPSSHRFVGPGKLTLSDRIAGQVGCRFYSGQATVATVFGPGLQAQFRDLAFSPWK
jgi:hypothetical protein